MRVYRFLIFLLLLSVLAVPVFASSPSDPTEPVDELAIVDVSLSSHLASWEVVSSLGMLHLYAASGVDSTGIVVIDNTLVNLTNSTVYFYSPEFPDYTFSATRFSPVSYRADNYNTLVNLTNSTVYFYSPEFPDYTFSATRFSPVSYRADNYNTSVLNTSSVKQVSVNLEDYYSTVLTFVGVALFFIVLWGVLFK